MSEDHHPTWPLNSDKRSSKPSLSQRIRASLRENFSGPEKNIDLELETEQQYKERWRSIYVIYFTMFLISLGFSVIITGVWPYLNKLDPTAGKEFMGYVVAANPLGQMLFSLLVGWWSNKLGSIRFPVILLLAVFTLTGVIYSSLELFDSNRKQWMLWIRFLAGVSSANIAACRSYLSAATRASERTKAVSMISMAQVLGFVVGPALQAVVVPLGDEGVWLIKNKLSLTMYTANSWINVLIALVNLYLFFPPIFKEHPIAAREAMLRHGKDNEKEVWRHCKPSYFASWTLIVAFFVIVFNFMLLETLGTAITMDQFAWTKGQSLEYMGIVMSVGGVLAVATFVAIPPLCKRYSEVKIMIWGGFFLMVVGRITFIPFQNSPASVFDLERKINMTLICDKVLFNKTVGDYDFGFNVTEWTDFNVSVIKNLTNNCGEDFLGCPSSQTWCYDTPALTITQFIIGYFLTCLGYPIAVTLIQTIFSKLLGPRPQGVWMGLITGSGCLARILCPVFVTYVYERFGTIWTFGLTSGMLIISLFWLLYFNKTLEPVDYLAVTEGKELVTLTAPTNDEKQLMEMKINADCNT